MFLKNYPNCCTAKVLVGFGQTLTADHHIRPDGNELSVEDIKADVGRKLNNMYGMAMLSCITNDQQVNANQALEELGFLSSDWMEKDNHPETRIKLWWFPIKRKQING